MPTIQSDVDGGYRRPETSTAMMIGAAVGLAGVLWFGVRALRA